MGSLMLASSESGICCPVGGHEQVANLPGARAILRVRAHHKIERFLTLNEPSRGLTAAGCLDESFCARNIQPLTRNPGSVVEGNGVGHCGAHAGAFLGRGMNSPPMNDTGKAKVRLGLSGRHCQNSCVLSG